MRLQLKHSVVVSDLRYLLSFDDDSDLVSKFPTKVSTSFMMSLSRNFLSFCRFAAKKAAIGYTYESNAQGAEQDDDEDDDEESSDEEIDLGCDFFLYQ